MFELNTHEQGPAFKIDGAEYHFRIRDDLNMREVAYMQYVGKQITKIQDEIRDGDTWDEKRVEELSNIIDEAVGLAVADLPDEVKSQLTDMQKIRLVEAFSDTVDLNETDSRTNDTPE